MSADTSGAGEAALKGCPFCGGLATIDGGMARDTTREGEPRVPTAFVKCSRCGCERGHVGNPGETMEDAEKVVRADWNRRAESRAEGREEMDALDWDDLGEECGFTPMSCASRKEFVQMVKWTIEQAEAKESAAGDVERQLAALKAEHLALINAFSPRNATLKLLHSLAKDLGACNDGDGHFLTIAADIVEKWIKPPELPPLPPPPGAEARPQKVGHWWCDQCAVVVPPEDVTYEEFHEHCDYKVTWKPEEPAGAGRAGEISAHVHMDADAPPEVREAVHELIVKAHEQLAEKPCEYDRLKAQRDAMEARDVERVARAIFDERTKGETFSEERTPDFVFSTRSMWYLREARAAIKALRGGGGGAVRDVRYFAIWDTFVGSFARTRKPKPGRSLGGHRVTGYVRADFSDPKRIKIKTVYFQKKPRKP